MPFTLTMPKLSPTMEEGVITKWRKKEGEYVKADEVLFEVATDKATVEHSALDAGWLRKIIIPEGGSAVVNQAVAVFTESKDESIEGYKPEGEAPKAQAPTAPVEKKEAAPEAAVASKASGAAMQQPAFVPEAPLEHYNFPAAHEGRVPATPLARHLAKERGIDLATVKGSGPGGRVISRDIDLGQPIAEVAFGKREAPTIIPGTYEEEALSPIRKVIARRLQESKTFIPHFYVTQEISVDALVALREQLKTMGVKVSINDFVLRACALALRQHPEINSGFNSVNETLIRFKTIDLSIAVSMDGGLITPIIRHADYKNLGEIAAEVKSLATRARQGKLAREEYMGGSFTVSNLGMFGVSSFAGIINPPQAALLAVGGVEEKPVVKEGSIIVGKCMNVTLSVDHRVIDGAEAAKFLKTVQKFLENPAALVL